MNVSKLSTWYIRPYNKIQEGKEKQTKFLTYIFLKSWLTQLLIKFIVLTITVYVILKLCDKGKL